MFKNDLLQLLVPEGEHFLENTPSPLEIMEMVSLKNANKGSTSSRDI